MASIKKIKTEILVIGAGAAGMAVANKLASAGISVLLADRRPYLGGILPQCIHNGFGLGYYGRDLTGPEYCKLQAEALRKSNAEIFLDTQIISINQEKFAIASNANGLFEIHFQHCIMATGCKETSLYSLPIAGTRPSGIYTAGEAQEMVNLGQRDIGKRIVILGSGDIGQIMARRFTLLGKEVVAIIECRDKLGGIKRNREECIEAFNIPVILNSTITEIHGYPELSSVTVSHLDSGQSELLLCDTLVAALGLVPDTELAQSLAKISTVGDTNVEGNVYPEWLYFCGNADYVHEIVDSVTFEAEALADRIGAKGQAVCT